MQRTKKLTASQVANVYNFLRSNGAVDGKYYRYNGDYDDTAVAEAFNITNNQVAHIRSAEFGILRDRVGNPNQLVGLESRVELLEKKMHELIEAHNDHINWVHDSNKGAPQHWNRTVKATS